MRAATCFQCSQMYYLIMGKEYLWKIKQVHVQGRFYGSHKFWAFSSKIHLIPVASSVGVGDFQYNRILFYITFSEVTVHSKLLSFHQ